MVAPLFCEEREASVSKFGLRWDSQAIAGNNQWNVQIGAAATPECAWGPLERDAVVPAGSDVTVLEDAIVPVGKSLTIHEGVTVRFDGYDESAQGVYSSLNELKVSIA